MNMIMMALMLFLVCGIAALIYLSKLNADKTFSSAACLMVTVIGIIGVQALFAFVGRLFPAMWIGVVLLLIAGIFGHFMIFRRCVGIKDNRFVLKDGGKELLCAFYSPALLGACIVFLGTLVLNRGLLVYRYDDLKQWGSAAKFMVENEALPREHEFFGSLNHYLTPTFFTSFFGIGGKWVAGKLVEHNLYAANMLFVAAGLCLPLGEFSWKQLKSTAAILTLSLLGITALYHHSTANLYVDVILAAWVGGTIGYMLLRRRLHGAYSGKEYGFLALVAAFTVFIKWGYGILAVAILAVVFLLIEYSMRKSVKQRVDAWLRTPKFWVGAAAVVLICALIIWLLSLIFGESLNKLLPGAGSLLKSVFDILFDGSEKAILTKDACLMGLFDQRVTRGAFQYGSFTALVLLSGFGFLSLRGVESKAYTAMMKRLCTVWICGSVLWFSLILVTYVSNFAFSEATIALSFNRYMGIYLMIGYFVLLYNLFLPEEYLSARKVTDGGIAFTPSGKQTKGITMRSLMRVLLALVLVLNVNTALVTESTGLNKDEITGYPLVEAVHAQSQKVMQVTGEDDPILYIAQGSVERGLHRARFDVGMNVSGYKPNSYKFAASGDVGYDLSVLRSVEELPQLLIDGGYQYIWVYETNKELNNFTEEYFGMRLHNASLYSVSFENGKVDIFYLCALE